MAIPANWAARIGLLAVLPLAGCGGRQPDVVAVTGTVKLGGRPMKAVLVQLIPRTGDDGRPGSYGTTDDQGRFDLRLYQEVGGRADGAVTGEHTVVLQDFDRPVTPPIPPSKIAPKFALPHQSPLRVTLTGPAELTVVVNEQGGVTVK
jgi:hypothetical protein